MPPEKAAVLKEWLRKAANDLGVCELILSSHAQFFEAASFHAQQATEKTLKAFLTYHDVRFRKIHDLRKIGKLILEIDPDLKPIIENAKILNPFAIDIRYPGEDKAEPFTLEEAKKHFSIAREVYEQILKRLPSESHPK